MRYISELREGENVVGHYLCKSKQTLKSKSGKSYLSLKLQDKTGVVDAKVWDLHNDIKAFEENDFIKIDGDVLIYQNDKQIKIRKIRRSMEGEYDPADYIPTTDKDIDQMYETFLGYIKTMKNPYLKQLLQEIFLNTPDVKTEFKYHSAAKTIHHGYRGGLLEHSLSVTEICDSVAGRYKYCNRDLLVAAAMLHDVGKVRELSDFPANDYTDQGQLLGHLIIGMEMVTEAVGRIPGFPVDLENLMKHCILSHHGEYEYGSPKLPSITEAFILHCADNLDAKTKVIEEMIDADSTQGKWVGYQRMLARNIRKSDF